MQQFTSGEVKDHNPKHFCCDLCAMDCKCMSPCPYECSLAEKIGDSNIIDVPKVREITDKQCSLLKEKLIELRQSLLAPRHNPQDTRDIPLFVGADLACGLSEGSIDSIVEIIETVSDLEEKCAILGNGEKILLRMLWYTCS